MFHVELAPLGGILGPISTPFDVLHHRAKSCKWVFPESVFSFKRGVSPPPMYYCNKSVRVRKITRIADFGLFCMGGPKFGQKILHNFAKRENKPLNKRIQKTDSKNIFLFGATRG